MLLWAAPVAGAGVVRVRDGGVGSCVPPESLLGRPWERLGHAQRYQVYIDPSAIAASNGKVEVWLLLSFSYWNPREEDWTRGSLVQRLRIDCEWHSFQLDEEHEFSLPMGSGCYLGGMGSFWGGRGMRRRYPPGWNEDIAAGTPEALAAARVCATP
ncbi:MAG TPA: surface-adhesin E family protein [Casimicrobiaceae bacterium]